MAGSSTQPKKKKIERENLSLAAEFAVASELCRRNIYAQLTLGRHKRTDLLLETDKGMIAIQVKAKQGREWPGVKGICEGNIILVLVDFENKKDLERPDFYILDEADWKRFIKEYVSTWEKSGKVKIEKNMPIWSDGYQGTGVKPQQVRSHLERWDKVQKLIEKGA